MDFLYRSAKLIELPEWGKYATGIFYLDKNTHLEAEKDFDTLAASLGIKVLYWRDVPVNCEAIGAVARKSEPLSRQVFVTADLNEADFIRRVRICITADWTSPLLIKEGYGYFEITVSRE